jgi:hypothetical protein
MGLQLYYKENDEFVAITNLGDLTKPLTTVHDGKTGDIQTVQVYLRNDDTAKWYSNIIIKPVDLVDANPYGDVIFTETGWGVKLSAGSDEPTSGEWDDLDWGDSINMSNVGADGGANTTSYYPFWFLITCPPNTDAKIKTDIVLNVSYTENSVI